MKIEVGKFYKLRNGEKAKIYSISGNVCNFIHGAVLVDGLWDKESWEQDGTYCVDFDLSSYDIISEWTEMGDGKLGL